VVLLVAGLTPVGEPFTTLMGDMEMGATPTP
jgi:membrane protein YqaA with SNARE-associated domain